MEPRDVQTVRRAAEAQLRVVSVDIEPLDLSAPRFALGRAGAPLGLEFPEALHPQTLHPGAHLRQLRGRHVGARSVEALCEQGLFESDEDVCLRRTVRRHLRESLWQGVSTVDIARQPRRTNASKSPTGSGRLKK